MGIPRVSEAATTLHACAHRRESRQRLDGAVREWMSWHADQYPQVRAGSGRYAPPHRRRRQQRARPAGGEKGAGACATRLPSSRCQPQEHAPPPAQRRPAIKPYSGNDIMLPPLQGYRPPEVASGELSYEPGLLQLGQGTCPAFEDKPAPPERPPSGTVWFNIAYEKVGVRGCGGVIGDWSRIAERGYVACSLHGRRANAACTAERVHGSGGRALACGVPSCPVTAREARHPRCALIRFGCRWGTCPSTTARWMRR